MKVTIKEDLQFFVSKMTTKEYNDMKGWEVPANEDLNEIRYFVVTKDSVGKTIKTNLYFKHEFKQLFNKKKVDNE